MGLGYEEIRKLKRDIIYCSATGYGQSGPYRDKAGHDINYLAISGILGCTGEHTGRPVIPGIPFGDMAGGGVFTALTIFAAILGRERTGKGQYLDVAQTDLLTSLNLLNLAEALAQEKGQQARPYNLRGATLCYNTFKTLDEKFIALGALEEKFWRNFCKAVGREEWIANHLLPYEEGEQATEDVKGLFASKTQQEWVELFEEVDTCLTPVLMPTDTLKDKHLRERETVTSMEDPQREDTIQIGFPAKFAEALDFRRSPAPFFGQHTQEILNSLGYKPSEIEQLANDGVI